MEKKKFEMLDANEAVAAVAYQLTESIAIYPITPSTPMAEWCDEWSAAGLPNLNGAVPSVVQMQSEAGVAGAIHGMLQAGSMSTTFTASQGLLLMIPNMYKIAGQLFPFCMHVTARTLATHALSIFGDHSDVMACRQTGFAMLCSNSPQEAQDLAVVAHLATLAGRVPFLHFFDGFRTSHEIQKLIPVTREELAALVDPGDVAAFRQRGMTPDHPTLRGTAQNPDTWFQAREACNPWYDRLPTVVESMMDRFGEATGRHYSTVEYVGDPEAERVLVLMGSGAETAEQTALWLNQDGEKVGVIKLRLYRPFPIQAFLNALPASCRALAVLDRTKEPGAPAEPLHLDVLAAFAEGENHYENRARPRVVGGRYGLSSKEFTPSMVRAVFENLAKTSPKNHFTVGIMDDVTHHSLKFDPDWHLPMPGVTGAIFYGLGSDGTVGANKNSIKLIGQETDLHAQGYFVYDSKKSGARTVSHLRFGKEPIHAPYLVGQANFIGCHQPHFLETVDLLENAAPGATLLLNTAHPIDKLWERLPESLCRGIRELGLRVFAIDAAKVAREAGMGGRINTVMQTCFFALSGVLPREEALEKLKDAARKTYAKKGEEMVQRNHAAIDSALAGLYEMPVPDSDPVRLQQKVMLPPEVTDFFQAVSSPLLAGKGDLLPVSAFPADGVWPTGTAAFEKRNLAGEIPVWDASICIQCNKCVLVCPHAAIRAKCLEPSEIEVAPSGFLSAPFRSGEIKDHFYTLQVAAEDCTGCGLCVQVCPAKSKPNPRHKAINMEAQAPLVDAQREHYAWFLDQRGIDPQRLGRDTVKMTQFRQPLFEYSGACAGCGETPYIKLLTQLFGDRLLIANATGCSSIYGGNLPTTPYTKNCEGRGPAWANSLFEDNAEFGLGIRLGADGRASNAKRLVSLLAPQIGDDLAAALLVGSGVSDEIGVAAQRERVRILKEKIAGLKSPEAASLQMLADDLVRRTVWILGGDGWAYDIGYGGLDHVMSGNYDVNILVLDTQVYSNTGGQQSKATPQAASAKFASNGKEVPRKQLGLAAMSYQTAYVASVAMGAKDGQTVSAFLEAESFPGPSLIVAYSHCIAHGFGLEHGMDQQKLAVDTGFWPLYRFDPRRAQTGEAMLRLDAADPKIPVSQFLRNEARFRIVEAKDKDRAGVLTAAVAESCRRERDHLIQLAAEKPSAQPEPKP